MPTIRTTGELRAALAEFPDGTPLRVNYDAGCARGDVFEMLQEQDAEFDGIAIMLD